MRIFKIEQKKQHKQAEVQSTVRYPVRVCRKRKKLQLKATNRRRKRVGIGE